MIFLNGMLLGYSDGIFLGWMNGCELGASYGGLLRNFKCTPAGRFGRSFGHKFQIGVNSGRQMNFPWEISNGPYLGDLEGGLVRNSTWTLAG